LIGSVDHFSQEGILMGPKTTENLKAAFAGESQAHMKYMIFADKAEKEGLRNIARLFSAVSFAERVHATAHHNVVFGVKPTAENLDSAVAGETYEVETMYPEFRAAAEKEGEQGALTTIRYAIEAEKIHAKLYARAKAAAASGKDLPIGNIQICSVCGHTTEGEAPDHCPVCGAGKEMFRKF
jgi:rubrerythrin